MKTKQVTVREGEHLGPIDWSFDFDDFLKGFVPASCNGVEHHNQAVQKALVILHLLEDHLECYEATTYGGWPRCGWGKIIQVGMYDGWPYWKPVPSVCIVSWSGAGEWHSFHNITDIRKIGEQWPMKVGAEE